MEEVVAREADAQRPRVLRAQRDIDETRVTRVNFGLRAIRRRRPAVQLRLGRLHGQIRALDESDLDVPPQSVVTLRRPRHQVGEGGVGLGQVGLEHDAGVECLELLFVEHAREGVDREHQVSVLFHVEIDERAVTLRLAVEKAHLRARRASSEPSRSSVMIWLTTDESLTDT